MIWVTNFSKSDSTYKLLKILFKWTEEMGVVYIIITFFIYEDIEDDLNGKRMKFRGRIYGGDGERKQIC